MKTRKLGLGALLLAPTLLLAAPGGKPAPVAEAYPDWQGFTAKSHISGREITPSDLRHKITVVIEVEANTNLQAQLVNAGGLAARGNFQAAFDAPGWETLEVPRDNASLLIVHGAKNHDQVLEAMKPKKGDDKSKQGLAAYAAVGMPGQGCPAYEGVTFTGAPDTEGKRPYAYVLGPAGKEILAQGPLNAETKKAITAAIQKAQKEMDAWDPKWVPFTGNLPPEKVHPTLAKALAKGRSGKLSPLEPVAKGLVKGTLSKDEETAKTAQIQYDAIYQARSDLIQRIQLEAIQCPHRAQYDIGELLKYFPSEKKRVEEASAKIKSKPEYAMLAKVFGRLMMWTDPNFAPKNAAEAKKITQELTNMKKKLAPIKEQAANITAQNGALIIDMKIDELIPQIQAKVPVK